MKAYLSKLFLAENRKLTITLLTVGGLLIGTSALMGISDNVPGITVLFTGIIFIFLAFIHLWRSAKSYLILILTSLVGGVFFAILHNLLEAAAENVANYPFLQSIMEVLSAGSFILAILVCPVGIFVGFFGAVLAYFLKKNPKKTAG